MAKKHKIFIIISAVLVVILTAGIILFNTYDLSEKNYFFGSVISRVLSRKNDFIFPVNGDVIAVYSEGTHNGIDIAASVRTPVKCCFDGTVSDIQYDEIYGITVVIDHGNGISGYYVGLDENVVVKIDQKVKIGEVIGAVGTTNVVESNLKPHLHFAMKQNGSWVDPLTYLKSGSPKVV